MVGWLNKRNQIINSHRTSLFLADWQSLFHLYLSGALQYCKIFSFINISIYRMAIPCAELRAAAKLLPMPKLQDGQYDYKSKRYKKIICLDKVG